jgi:hypothetical protein
VSGDPFARIPGRHPSPERLGDEPLQDQYRAQMVAIARALDQFLNGDVTGPDRGVGFVLLVYPFNEKGGRCNYISNGANRDDVAKLMEEQAKRFRGASP